MQPIGTHKLFAWRKQGSVYRWGAAVLCLVLCVSAWPANRSSSARAAFQRIYHCPSTGKPRGACPGYVVDHVVPLCAGGADDALNMQWQTVAAAKIKDRTERIQCKARR